MATKKNSPKSTEPALASARRVEQCILILRGHRVLLGQDLARLYDVPVKQMNKAVQRNRDRFPSDFMFQLTWDETRNLRFQIGTLEPGPHFRYRPYVFTEHGAVMLAAVLNSPLAVQSSIQVVRAFVRLRRLLASNAALRRKLEKIEQALGEHDERFAQVFATLQSMLEDEDDGAPSKPRIGYQTEAESK